MFTTVVRLIRQADSALKVCRARTGTEICLQSEHITVLKICLQSDQVPVRHYVFSQGRAHNVTE